MRDPAQLAIRRARPATASPPPGDSDVFRRFLQLTPSWLDDEAPDSPIHQQQSRRSWCLVELSSRRVLDLVSHLADPERLPSVAQRWKKLELARNVAYDRPWAHAVLRALELTPQPSAEEQLPWFAERLGTSLETVRECVSALVATGQARERRKRYSPAQSTSVSTKRVPERARQLKVEGTRTALSRLEHGSPGRFGYSIFTISRSDLRELASLHAEYVRAMQVVIARSTNGECVGLFCAQLLDMAARDNALDDE